MKKTILLFSSLVLKSILYGQYIDDCGPYINYFTPLESGCNYDPYVLVFEDNFDGNSLDLTKWNPYTGVPRDSGFNQQKAWHLPENIEVGNGTMKIITKKLSTPYTGTFVSDWSTSPPTMKTSNFDYTTGEIWSKRKFGHGKFEIRCKIPKGKGFWPAFWTYADPPWNEIDVFEFWNENSCTGNYEPGRLSKNPHFNIHVDLDGDDHSENCGTDIYNPCGFWNGPDYSSSFHTFTMIWDNYKIAWYIDGDFKRIYTRYRTLTEQQIDCNGINGHQHYLQNQLFPLDPMNIVTNLAIQHGNDDNGNNNEPDESTPFPSALEIDYIRYYKQMPCDGSVDISSLSLSPEVYNVIIGTTINLSGNFTVQSGQQLTVIASDDIILGPGFTVDEGSNFVASIDDSICLGGNKMAGSAEVDSIWINKNQLSNEPNYSSAYNTASIAARTDCNVKIFPNPSKGRITMELSANSINNYEIYLIDMQGRVLYSQTNIENTSIEIDLTDYSSGTYFLNIIDTKDNNAYSHKIVKD